MSDPSHDWRGRTMTPVSTKLHGSQRDRVRNSRGDHRPARRSARRAYPPHGFGGWTAAQGRDRDWKRIGQFGGLLADDEPAPSTADTESIQTGCAVGLVRPSRASYAGPVSTQPEQKVNIYDAKTGLSRLISRVEQGERIVISRNGRPVARLVPYAAERPVRSPGLWRGQVSIHADFDDFSDADQRDWYGR